MKKILLVLLFFVSSMFSFENINSENFNKMVENKKVILDFYASWCPPCNVISKHLKIYDKSKNDNVYIYKVDIDNEKSLLKRFGVKSIPTLVYLKNGQPIFKELGIRNNKEIKSNVEEYLR